MFASKPKQKIKRYQSQQNIQALTKKSPHHKKSNKNAIIDEPKNIKAHKKYRMSRYVTEASEKKINKEHIIKYNPFFTSPAKCANESKRQGYQQMTKNRLSGQHRLGDTVKCHSPTSPKFVAKTQMTQYEPLTKFSKRQKKPLKKEKMGKEVFFERSSPTSHQIKSVLIEKTDKKVSVNRSKSKQRTNQSKSKKKIQKNLINISNNSTPSCLMSEDIQMIDLVDEGTFGQVFKGKHRKTGEMIAIKKVLQDSRYKNRQLEIISMLKNDFVVEILGNYISHDSGQQYLNIMMAYYEQNLFHRINLYKRSSINYLQTKIILYQIFKGLSYLHSLGICHRDIKPENILLKGSSVVICDFGSAKILDSRDSNISYICARCYRAPQLIFGSTHYSTAIDIWSAGCVILEILNGDPLFIGETSINHLQQIMRIMGSPTREEVLIMNPDFCIQQYLFPPIKKISWNQIFPDVDKSLLDLISMIMVYDPTKRAHSAQVLAHQYFDEIRDRFTYQHIKGQYRLKDFFNFSDQELKNFSHLKQRLIPEWYPQKTS